MANPFKNSRGNWILGGLFIDDTIYPSVGRSPEHARYTLSIEDKVVNGKTYPSLYRLYMECSDPTEYDFATKYMGGYEHWVILTKCSWFIPYLETWRKELEVKIKSQALNNIIMLANDPNSKANFNANKYLLENFGVSLKNKVVGRPKKDSKDPFSEKRDEILKDILKEFNHSSFKENVTYEQ